MNAVHIFIIIMGLIGAVLIVTHYLLRRQHDYFLYAGLTFLILSITALLPPSFRWVAMVLVVLSIIFTFHEAWIDFKERLQQHRIEQKTREQTFFSMTTMDFHQKEEQRRQRKVTQQDNEPEK